MTGQEAIKQMLAHVEACLETVGSYGWDAGAEYQDGKDAAYESMRDFLIELAEAEQVLADQELNGYGDAQ